ncbi:MAG: hypothetical protein JXB32_18415 [Deltaproteobacteria bacterium]|nr:hypothetical protein [Deltaproteobacteria bacterium]
MRPSRAPFPIAVLAVALAGCGSATDPPDDRPGTVTGHVTAASGLSCASDPDDCVGVLFLYVVEEDPLVTIAQTPLAITVVDSADLSGGNRVPYTLTDVPPGTWYLAGFLDDDANASRMAPMPDLGDPIPYPFPQVTVEPAASTTRDVVLSLRMP